MADIIQNAEVLSMEDQCTNMGWVDPNAQIDLSLVPWYNWLQIVVLVILSGCFSGLNLGVLGLDTKDLELMTQGPFETKED